MEKLVNYRCSKCKKYHREKYCDTNIKIPKKLKDKCPECGGTLEMFNFKNNKQQWELFDNRKKS